MIQRRALVTIEPRGPKGAGERQYQVRFILEIDGLPAAEMPIAMDIAKLAMQPLAESSGAECEYGQLTTKTKTSAIEARVAVAADPPESAMQHLRATLSAAGFAVVITEARECDECMAMVMVPRGQTAPPAGWHANTICGKHQYKRCEGCGSVYAMSSTNAGGQAPSVKCEVCDAVLVEWGGTKLWTADLVKRADDR